MTLGTVHFSLDGDDTTCGEGGLTTDREEDVTCGDCDSLLARDAEEDRERYDSLFSDVPAAPAIRIKSTRNLKVAADARSERALYRSYGERGENVYRMTRFFYDGVIGLGDRVLTLDNGQKTILPVQFINFSREELEAGINEDYDQAYVPMPSEYRNKF